MYVECWEQRPKQKTKLKVDQATEIHLCRKRATRNRDIAWFEGHTVHTEPCDLNAIEDHTEIITM